MQCQVRNRKATASKLATFLDEMVVPPELIQAIMDEPVSEDYVEHLVTLSRKLKFSREDEFARNSAALADVQPELERLRVKAVAKVSHCGLLRFWARKTSSALTH